MHLYARDYGGATSKYERGRKERELMKVNVIWALCAVIGFHLSNEINWARMRKKGRGDYDVDE